MSPPQMLLLLLLAHVSAGIVAAFVSANGPATSSAIFLAIVFCQVALVGMWGGIGAGHWMLRFLGVAAGSAYLAVQLGFGIDELEPQILLLVILPTIVVWAVTSIVRLFHGKIQRASRGQIKVRQRPQFSVQHLLFLTFLVASLTLLGKTLVPNVYRDNLVVILVLAACYTAVALASIWAVTGRGNVWNRTVFVGVIALVAGAAGAYVTNRGTDVRFWVLTTLLQAALLVGSLWVIRIAGYRFMAKWSPGKDGTRTAPACHRTNRDADCWTQSTTRNAESCVCLLS